MNAKDLKISDIKVVKVTKESPTTVLYKHSFGDEFKEYTVLKQNKKEKDFRLLQCCKEMPGLPQKKRWPDAIVQENLIPKHHHKFYEDF